MFSVFSTPSWLRSFCSTREDSEMEAFGVEFEEVGGLPVDDLAELAALASFTLESGASSKFS